MDWNQPINITPPPTPFARLVALLGHYDTRFYCAPGSYVDVGAGSLPVVDQLRIVPSDRGKVGEIGRFCEVNESARIVVHGDHDHDKPVNITMAALPIMQGGYDEALKPFRPFSIGNDVVISAGAFITSGVSIGDGAVIGGGAIVRADVDPWSIVAGAPASPIRSRTPSAAWWNWETAYILENKSRLQVLAADLTAPHRYRAPRPRFCLSLINGALSFMGVCEGDAVLPLSNTPPKVAAYVTQALQAEKPFWLADCWS